MKENRTRRIKPSVIAGIILIVLLYALQRIAGL